MTPTVKIVIGSILLIGTLYAFAASFATFEDKTYWDGFIQKIPSAWKGHYKIMGGIYMFFALGLVMLSLYLVGSGVWSEI